MGFICAGLSGHLNKDESVRRHCSGTKCPALTRRMCVDPHSVSERAVHALLQEAVSRRHKILYYIRALVIRIGFWGPLYYKHHKEPQTSVGNYVAPTLRLF